MSGASSVRTGTNLLLPRWTQSVGDSSGYARGQPVKRDRSGERSVRIAHRRTSGGPGRAGARETQGDGLSGIGAAAAPRRRVQQMPRHKGVALSGPGEHQWTPPTVMPGLAFLSPRSALLVSRNVTAGAAAASAALARALRPFIAAQANSGRLPVGGMGGMSCQSTCNFLFLEESSARNGRRRESVVSNSASASPPQR